MIIWQVCLSYRCMFAYVTNAMYQVSALGGLLAYMSHQGRLNGHWHSAVSANGIQVSKILLFKMDSYMQVNMETLMALQVFDPELHPNAASGKTKEGLSVFGIMNFTKSVQGAHLLKEWFTRPLQNIEQIRRRLDVVELFQRNECFGVLQGVQKNMRYMINMTVIPFIPVRYRWTNMIYTLVLTLETA